MELNYSPRYHASKTKIKKREITGGVEATATVISCRGFLLLFNRQFTKLGGK